MKKIAYFLCVVMLFGLSALPAAADDGTTVGQVTGGFEFFSGDFNNAKFNEYRVDRQGPFGGFFSADYLSMPTDGTHRYQFDLGYRSLEDIGANIDVLDYGKYHVNLNYQRLGHDFANSALSLYSGDGTGRLTLPDNFRTNSTNTTVLANTFENDIANAHTIDLFLVRDRFNAGFDWMSLGPLTFNANFGYEHREGDRPYGGTFGFSNAVEIPEPINYDTYNVKAGAEYAEKFMYANVSYAHSSFDNNIQSVIYDNPEQLFGVNAANKPSEGMNALAPSNTSDSVNLVLAKNLPLDSRLMFNFNYAWLRQDEQLIQSTINPNLIPTVTNPENNANAAVDTSSCDVRFSSRPLDKLEVTAGYRYYNHDNETPADKIFQFYPYDATTTSAGPSDPTEYVSWISRTGNIEATYEVYSRTHIGVGYDYDSESYRNGSENSVSANTYKVFADSRAFDWLNTRLTLSFEDKNTAYPDATDSELPWLRKFYAASDQSYKADWMNTFTLTDDLSLMLQYTYADDQYDDSLFGLLNDRTHTATLETDYNLTKNVTVGAFYTYENQRSRQKSRQWNPGPPDTVSFVGNPFYAAYDTPSDFSNWQLKQNYNIHTVGLNSTIGIIPEKLTLSLDGTYSIVNGEANFKSDIGTAANDLNPYTLFPYEHVDETELIQAGGTIKYNFTKALAFALGYRYEKWHDNDYQYDGLTNVVTTAGGAYRGLLDMNTLYKPYEVHTAYASVTYKF